jgi:nitrite reductase/ring-hydroxylating ferredoxin subunit
VPSSYEVGGISTRPVTLPDGRPGAVVVGQPRRAGSMSPDAWDSLHDWATRALSAGAPTFRWGAQDLRSLDLLPYVGRTRRSPHVLVATGLNGWGFTNAAALADQIPLILDREGAYRPDEVNVPRWQADRVLPSGGWTDAAATTWWMGRSVVGDLVRSMLHGGDDLRPGQGRVRGGPLDPLAECITTDGERHCVSARCTHMGCLVRWNGTEQSWDCPCHGSRFDPEGRVLEGPARTPLERP